MIQFTALFQRLSIWYKESVKRKEEERERLRNLYADIKNERGMASEYNSNRDHSLTLSQHQLKSTHQGGLNSQHSFTVKITLPSSDDLE